MAHKIWNSPEAMAAISQPEPSAAKSAKAIIDYNERVIKSAGEAEGRILAFVQFLKNLNVNQLQAISPDAKTGLQQALETILKLTETLDQK